jgi:Rps23 Pro-64 3,4-dihydroxylase Tpa1-like proline 4-hydroxylase
VTRSALLERAHGEDLKQWPPKNEEAATLRKALGAPQVVSAREEVDTLPERNQTYEMDLINPIDWEALQTTIRSAKPIPFFCLDNFLREDFASEAADAFPPFGEALKLGRTFSAVNERGKVQITDASKFAPPLARLNQVLADPGFLQRLSKAFELPPLLADEELIGGGLHETGPRGHLDVHVDFNYLEERKLHRRLNILLYLNKDWKPEWGGEVELWDSEVKIRHHAFLPIFNRCLVFVTNEVSYHGTAAVRCPGGVTRKSFAAYYYTREAPPGWDGKLHDTVFKARPDERFKGEVLMPLERLERHFRFTVRGRLSKLKRKLLRQPPA